MFNKINPFLEENLTFNYDKTTEEERKLGVCIRENKKYSLLCYQEVIETQHNTKLVFECRVFINQNVFTKFTNEEFNQITKEKLLPGILPFSHLCGVLDKEGKLIRKYRTNLNFEEIN